MHEIGFVRTRLQKFRAKVQVQNRYVNSVSRFIVQDAEEIIAPLLAFSSAPNLYPITYERTTPTAESQSIPKDLLNFKAAKQRTHLIPIHLLPRERQCSPQPLESFLAHFCIRIVERRLVLTLL